MKTAYLFLFFAIFGIVLIVFGAYSLKRKRMWSAVLGISLGVVILGGMIFSMIHG